MSSACVVCARAVRVRQHGLSCDKCGKWTHRTCDTGISAVEYREAVREDADFPFKCKHCAAAEQLSELKLHHPIPAPRKLKRPIPAPRKPTRPIPAPRQLPSHILQVLESSEDPSMPPESRPAHPESPEREWQPLQPEEPAMSQERQPLQPEEPAMSPERQPLQPEEPAMFPEQQPLQPEEPAMFPLQPEDPAMSPERQPMQPEEPAMSPERQPLQPEEPAMSPERQPMQPEEPAMSPERQPLQPEEPAMSPERELTPDETYGQLLEPLTEQLELTLVIDPVQFEIIPNGSKNCKDLLVDTRGYTYNIKRPTASGRDWQCSVRGKESYCRANVKERNGVFTRGAKEHSHAGAPGIQVAKRITAKVKNDSVENVFKSSGSVAERVLFTMGDADLPAASRPNLHNLTRIASRARQLLRPKDPGPTDFTFEIATNFIPKDFLRADIYEDNQRILIFYTDEAMEYMCQISTWFVDGTFKVMRKPFDQLFSIHGFLSNDDGSCLKQVPLLFAYMTRKTTEDYVLVFKKILELAPRPPVVEVLVADFEKATWAATRQTMPTVAVRGCQFHWGQRVWRKAQAVGLQEEYHDRGDVYRVVRSLMSLPYLPVEEVAPIFHAAFGNLTDPRLLKLRKYVNDNWMESNIFSVTSWNVFRRPTRTNNDCEGWHRRINHAAGDNTAFYQMVPFLHEEARKFKLQKVMVEEGSLKRIQRRAVRERNQKFYDLWDKYDAGDISAMELLKSVSQVVGPVLGV